MVSKQEVDRDQGRTEGDRSFQAVPAVTYLFQPGFASQHHTQLYISRPVMGITSPLTQSPPESPVFEGMRHFWELLDRTIAVSEVSK